MLDVRARVTRTGVDDLEHRFVWKVALGSPETVHNPVLPYRAPFGAGGAGSPLAKRKLARGNCDSAIGCSPC